MTSRDFAFWLQGFMELRGSGPMDEQQVKCVAAHLALVFKHEIDPSMGDKPHQETLDAIHAAGKAQGQIGGTGPSGTVYRC